MPHATRLAKYAQISSALALHSNESLTRLVDEATQLAAGIGGTTLLLDLEGRKVFAKRVRLTDLERRPEHLMSTANLFQLPTFCQRNVGSPGCGVWRELAANVLTTNWVLAGQATSFPLMYHWRVLPGAAAPTAPPLSEDLADLEGMIQYWEDCPAMAERLRALAQASASVLIFLEYIPQHLDDWLSAQLAAGPDAFDAACTLVEHGLETDLALMNDLGLLHGDAHFQNILTDGQRLYFADLGLALSTRFELSEAELHYLQQNANLDRCYVPSKWVNWLVKAHVPDASPPERMELVRRCAAGDTLAGLPPTIAAIIRRRAPMAVVINDFYAKLHGERRSTPYPWREIEELERAGCDAWKPKTA